MIEDEIRELRLEMRALREAIEKVNRTAALLPTPAVNNPADQADYLDDKAAAHLVNISVASLRRWRILRQGPPYRKIGYAVRYSRAELLAWVDRQPGFEGGLKVKR